MGIGYLLPLDLKIKHDSNQSGGFNIGNMHWQSQQRCWLKKVFSLALGISFMMHTLKKFVLQDFPS